MSATEALVGQVTRWASPRDDIIAIALVGSHARGTARPDSDIDLVLLCSRPDEYVSDSSWVDAFGEPAKITIEDWGLVQSVRVLYEHGPEVEFGIAPVEWAANPPPPGTMDVLRGGARVLMDREGSLSNLARIQPPST